MSAPSATAFADGWSPRRVELLREHHARGLTARESAELLGGVTRDAVISKRNRLGLPQLRRPESTLTVLVPPAQTRLRRGHLAALCCAPLPQMDLTPPCNVNPKPLVERKRRECAWPLGPAEAEGDYRTLFCCAPARRRSPYCPEHAALARRVE